MFDASARFDRITDHAAMAPAPYDAGRDMPRGRGSRETGLMKVQPNVSPIASRTSRMVSRASSCAFSQPSARMLRTWSGLSS